VHNVFIVKFGGELSEGGDEWFEEGGSLVIS